LALHYSRHWHKARTTARITSLIEENHNRGSSFKKYHRALVFREDQEYPKVDGKACASYHHMLQTLSLCLSVCLFVCRRVSRSRQPTKCPRAHRTLSLRRFVDAFRQHGTFSHTPRSFNSVACAHVPLHAWFSCMPPDRPPNQIALQFTLRLQIIYLEYTGGSWLCWK
jgi:hypothetical protein